METLGRDLDHPFMCSVISTVTGSRVLNVKVSFGFVFCLFL